VKGTGRSSDKVAQARKSSPAKAAAELERRATQARKHAYAPYSKFHVGAAVQMNGHIFEGANVENASYPLSVCAERNAIAAAVTAGARDLEAVCVATDASPPAAPCGGCRQVLREFAADPLSVAVTAINPHGERRSWTLAELLPDSFSGRDLP
jgi:cytidine deaminase